jgi:hypothetical protein
MERGGHLGITLGLTSFRSLCHVREQVAGDLDRNKKRSSENIQSLRERLTDRLPHIIAAGVVTETAVLTSTRLDAFEKLLFGPENHRSAFHSFVYSTGIKKTAELSTDWICEQTAEFCRWLGIGNKTIIERAINSAGTLLKAISDGLYTGQLTHLLGDIPTKGKAGIAALPLLTPFTEHSFTLDLVKSTSTVANTLLLKAGIAVAFASWLGIGVYAAVPRWPKSILKDAIHRAIRSDLARIARSIGARMRRLPAATIRLLGATADTPR